MTAETAETGHRHGPANRRRWVLSGTAPLFVAEPAGPVRGGVVVVHDVLGLTESVEQHCRRLAGQGWLTVAPYHYYESGGRDYPDLDSARRVLAELDTDGLRADVQGARNHLVRRRGLDPGTVSVLDLGLGAFLGVDPGVVLGAEPGVLGNAHADLHPTT